MMPIAPLMIEHRLIERMIKVIKKEIDKISKTGKASPEFVDHAVDFIRTYADRCHHGKEEDILFRQLTERKVSDHLGQIMGELVEEHIRARALTAAVVAAKERYVAGEPGALDDMKANMSTLVDFYPVHIEKEDRHFFMPCMEYFSTHEQDLMMEEFAEFDRTLIHDKYRGVIERLEGK